ncbi:hypothetical protein ONS95_012584 [Cadophora gregata]|uniref:uncharacterized protein n=1 Tax=Cadophora gregata TaxID=51156 RepID=UPI0026DD21CD|nr:uncharacterized protein ONS95_012584 [Cadophora gregata]KAK0118287.1 hypothetical protein ONS95_012584 [Cadophora gregata]
MPAVVAKGAIVVVAAAVAAAIAVYESPQARQFAEDVRRRIAIALHSLGDEINPASQQPRFNRPEDAEGFLQSQASADLGVDADEESKRRQREELMYWNAVHLEKLEKERKLNGDRPANRSRGSSFDDFLQEDATAEKGTYVYNTGTDVRGEAEEGLRSRNVRGLNRGSFYANPFSDEHNIDTDEQQAVDSSLMSPEESEKVEVMSDLYSANEEPRESRQTTATIAEQLVDTSDAVPDPPVSYPMMEDPMGEDTDYANMAARDDSAYASIHAWADNANSSFYSPLPVTPRSASPRLQIVPGSPTFSDPDISVPGSGEATPTDSVSLAGSGEEIWAPRSGATSEADVMSVDGEGISTPGSWTEVGSEVSENDVGVLHN